MHHIILLVIFHLAFISVFFAADDAFSQTVQFGQIENWTYPSGESEEYSLSVKWRYECGDGRCQVVSNEDRVFVLSGNSTKNGNKTQIKTVAQSLNKENGERIWSKSFESLLQQNQQTFSGAIPSPQSTPILCSGKLIFLTFTGQLIALDISDGQTVWQIDLVNDIQAEPVQFGFSSSPVIDPDGDGRIIVLAGGENGGLLNLNASNGEIVWKSACDSSSYATPIRADFGDTNQWVVVTKDLILGIDAAKGSRLWEYEMPEAGLTNVPTPLIIDQRRMIVSGQGIQGTRCISVSRNSENWEVREEWFNRKVQFFYSNWLKLNDQMVLGCSNNFLIALATLDGRTIGRFRGFADGNLIRMGKQLIVVDGKGNLTILQNQTAGITGDFVADKKFQVLEERCWTPVSVDKNEIYIRGGKVLCCLKLGPLDSKNPLQNILTKSKPYSLTKSKLDTQTDPVQTVFEAFENGGLDKALEVYSKLRAAQKLGVEARIAIAQGAAEQGLDETAVKILNDALEDFPNADEVRAKLKELDDQRKENSCS